MKYFISLMLTIFSCHLLAVNCPNSIEKIGNQVDLSSHNIPANDWQTQYSDGAEPEYKNGRYQFSFASYQKNKKVVECGYIKGQFPFLQEIIISSAEAFNAIKPDLSKTRWDGGRSCHADLDNISGADTCPFIKK